MCGLALLFAVLASDASARNAHESEGPDTEHLFGFTAGADIGEKGEKELESETLLHTGKSGGSYTAAFEQLEAKYTVTQNFRIAAAAVLAYHHLNGVPDTADLDRGSFQGGLLDARFRLLDRAQSRLGLTLAVEPHASRIDDITGERVENYGGIVTVALDKELIARRLYAAVNVFYQPEVTHVLADGAWTHQSTLGVSGAMTMQAMRGVFIGGELVYRGRYDGLGFNSLAGKAVFLGPTFYATLSKHWWASVAWSAQVAGRATEQPGALDLVNFERHRALLRLGYHF